MKTLDNRFYVKSMQLEIGLLSVVYNVMCRVATVAKTKSMPFLLFVGDQPVYALIVQLKYENQELFDRILPFLGPFHT